MVDDDRWWRLLLHLLEHQSDDSDGWRHAVNQYAAIHWRLTRPEN